MFMTYLKSDGLAFSERKKNKDAVVASMDLLPDGIVSDIISRLTIRDAVRTSVLARRWRFLSASLTNLNFDWPTVLGIMFPRFCEKSKKNNHDCQHRFVRIVNQILNNYLRERIRTFRICFCVRREFSDEIDQWISLAVRFGVESLQLHFSCGQHLMEGATKRPVECKHKEYYIFPCHLLPPSGNSMLKHLFLQSCSLGPDLNNQFSSLITLKLFDVPLAQSDLEKIFSSCLNIECLNFEWCSLPITFVVGSSLLHLKSLAIWFCFDVKEVKLSAPSMTTFEYAGDLVSFSFLEVRNLEKLQFLVECNMGLGYIFSQLGQVVPHVKTLSVISNKDWVEHIPERLLTFTNVKKLELYFYKYTKFHIPKIFAILEACPLLQNFHLVTNTVVHELYAFESAKLGGLMHNHLKEVVVGAFCGNQSQILFLMQLVEYAAVLEQLSLTEDSVFHRDPFYWDVSSRHCRLFDFRMLPKKLQDTATSKKVVISLPSIFQDL